MGRIRTIKPEFPQSESMGRVSRDARLLFVLMWTLADDSGRLRGSSRMLASLLFPYDDDAPKLIGDWITELEAEGCIVRYDIEGSTYIQIAKWLSHQKIDKPSESKIPPFDEHSRILANTREFSPLDQGSRKGVDQGKEGIKESSSRRGSRLPQDWSLTPELEAYCRKERPDLDPARTADRFRDYWVAKAGKEGVKLDWAATWRNWVRNEKAQAQPRNEQQSFAARNAEARRILGFAPKPIDGVIDG